MVSSSLVVTFVVALMVPAQAGHICNSGIHYFVEHTAKCPNCYSSFLRGRNKTCEKEAEMLGCNLFDFARGKRFNRLSDQQVHWPGGVEGLTAFEYTQHNDVPGHETCLMMSHCDTTGYKYDSYWDEDVKCYGTTHEEFPMPDYCSRAITSELSTVYNGVKRTTALSAGAKVLFASAGKRCSWSRWRGTESVVSEILDGEHTTKACWNHANDWRRMYCTKYHECKCPDGLTPEECSRHEASVNCCKGKYQEFLKSEYNVYKGYPLKKECVNSEGSWGCEYNPDDGRQTEFDKAGAQDFSNLY